MSKTHERVKYSPELGRDKKATHMHEQCLNTYVHRHNFTKTTPPNRLVAQRRACWVAKQKLELQ